MRFCFVFFYCFSMLAKSLSVQINAPYAILMNADSGAILYEKQAHTLSYPASTTKIATALFLLEKTLIPLDQMLLVSSESLKKRSCDRIKESPPYWWDTDGTRMGLKVGEKLSLDALLYGMMLVSGNDAANVIAEGVSGAVPAFMEALNQYLHQIGCVNTRFVNPHGSHHPDHMTTAYDLCLMTKHALQIPKFREVVSAISYTIPKTNKQGPIELKQGNRLLKPGKWHYPKAIGVKTGFHSSAKNALVAAAQDGGRTLIAVILGNPNREDRYSDAIRLFEAAFSEGRESRRFFGVEHVFIRHFSEAKVVLKASLKQDLSISYYSSEEPSCRAFVHWEVLSLPIHKGQKIGEVHVIDSSGSLLGKESLFAKEDVKKNFFYMMKKWVSYFF